jgi:hypothetical protein
VDFTGLYWTLLDFTGLYWTLLDFTGLDWTLVEYLFNYLLIFFQQLEDVAALDFFLQKNQVCWTEISLSVIRCSEIDPRHKGKVEKVLKNHMFFDYISRTV